MRASLMEMMVYLIACGNCGAKKMDIISIDVMLEGLWMRVGKWIVASSSLLIR